MTMVRKLPGLLLCAALAASAIGAGDALAADRPRDRARQHERAADERVISLDEAVARAERRYKARAVRAESRRRGDRIEYRIRLLAEDGRVFEVRVDAASGREN